MADLKSHKLIWLKGWLFLFCGMLAGGLLIWSHPDVKTAGLLAVCVWCFMRFYYFVFYAIEKYIDPGYRFSGVGAFIRYLTRARTSGE